jgi:hypothetical protein
MISPPSILVLSKISFKFQEIPGVFRGVEDFVEEAVVNVLDIGGCVFHCPSIIIFLPVFFNRSGIR